MLSERIFYAGVEIIFMQSCIRLNAAVDLTGKINGKWVFAAVSNAIQAAARG
jgi:hypothetical protein